MTRLVDASASNRAIERGSMGDISPDQIHRIGQARLSDRTLMARFAMIMLTVALLLSAQSASLAAQVDQAQVQRASDWLVSQQDESGGFIGLSGEPDASLTADAIIALAAASRVGIDVDLQPAIDFLAENALVLAQTGPGSAAKFSLALSSAGIFTRDFAGVDPLSIVEVAAKNGMIGNGPFDHALGLLALVAAESEVPDSALQAAFDTQLDDGSWSFDGAMEAGSGDSNTTALMTQAVVAGSVPDETAADPAVNYLLSTQQADGSFAFQPTSAGDSNSTALTIQALIAVDSSDHDEALGAAFEALGSFQNANGSLSWMLDPRDENAFSTVQGLPALASLALPLPAEADLVGATPVASPESSA